MGAEQQQRIEKKLQIGKERISIAARRARIHLQMTSERKRTLITGMQTKLRNKLSEARNREQERCCLNNIVQAYRYYSACKVLITYCNNVQQSSAFISQNLHSLAQLGPLLPQINSIIYSADTMDLFTLDEFKNLLKDVGNPNIKMEYITAEMKELVLPNASEKDIHLFVVHYCKENDIDLAVFNQGGHHFKEQWSEEPASRGIQKNISQHFYKEKVKENTSIESETDKNISERSNSIKDSVPNSKKSEQTNALPVSKKTIPKPIDKIEDLELYPQIEPNLALDSNFDKICLRLRQIL